MRKMVPYTLADYENYVQECRAMILNANVIDMNGQTDKVGLHIMLGALVGKMKNYMKHYPPIIAKEDEDEKA